MLFKQTFAKQLGLSDAISSSLGNIWLKSMLCGGVIASAACFTACGDIEEVDQVAPVIEATSQAVVVVGQTLEFYGRNFLKDDEGSSRLYFSGSFVDHFGRVSAVDFGVTPFFGGQEVGEDGRHILTWSRFGPFKNPFTGDARHGTFAGSVQVMNYYNDGTVEEGPAQVGARRNSGEGKN